MTHAGGFLISLLFFVLVAGCRCTSDQQLATSKKKTVPVSWDGSIKSFENKFILSQLF
jgi:hypothetical protein